MTQAITPRSVLPGPGTESIWNIPFGRRLFLKKAGSALVAASISISPLGALAQSSEKTKPEEKVLPLIVVQKAEIRRQNIALAQDKFQRTLVFPFEVSDVNRFENLYSLVLHQNPGLWSNLYDHRATWEKLLSMLYEGKYLTLHPDQYHSTGIGNRPYIRDTIVYPGLFVGNPLHQFEMADNIANGQGFWGSVASHLDNIFEKVWGGAQWRSNSIIEENWLQIYDQAFTVRQAFAEYARQTQIGYQKSREAWFTLYKAPLLIDEAEKDQFIKYRLANLSNQAAGPDADLDSEKILDRNTESEKATHKLQTVPESEALAQNALAMIIVPDETALKSLPVDSLEPRGPILMMDREMLGLASRVPDLLRSEGYSKFIPAVRPLASEKDFESALRSYFAGETGKVTSVSDLFTPDGDAGFRSLFASSDFPVEEANPSGPIDTSEAVDTGHDPALSLPSLQEVFMPLDPNMDLAPSPTARLLELQKAELEQVQRKLIDLKGQNKIEVDVHLDIGTLPLLAELLNFEYLHPTQSTHLSLADLKHETDLRIESLDAQIKNERDAVRTEFRNARTRRQTALQNYLAAVNEIARQNGNLNAGLRADRDVINPDVITPYLEIQKQRVIAKRSLIEALQALAEARFYTVPVQQALENEFVAFHLEVAKKLDTNSVLTPEDLNPTVPPAPVPAPPKKSLFKRLGGNHVFHEAIAPLLAIIMLGKPMATMLSTLRPDAWLSVLAVSIGITAVAIPAVAPTVRNNWKIKLAFPLAGAALVAYLLPVTHGTILFVSVTVFLMWWYQAGSYKRHFTWLMQPLLTVGLVGILLGFGMKFLEVDQQSTAEVANETTLNGTSSTNYSAGMGTIRLPALWAPPPEETFEVVEANRFPSEVPKTIDGKPNYIITQVELDSGLLARLNEVNVYWAENHPQENLISPELLQARPAPIRIQTQYGPNSPDVEISGFLDEIDGLRNDNIQLTKQSQYNAEVAGTQNTAPSFQVEMNFLHIREIGIKINVKLMTRQEDDVPVLNPFTVFREAGVIAKGSPITDKSAVPLFTQSFPHDSVLWLGMSPADVRALIRLAHQLPKQATLHLHATDGSLITIPLSDIQPIPEDDPIAKLFPNTAVDYRGQSYSEPIEGLGFEPTVPTIFITNLKPGTIAQDSENRRLLFDGVYDANGHHVSLLTDDGVIGTVRLINSPPTTPPYRTALPHLEKEQEELQVLIVQEEAFRNRLHAYQRQFPGNDSRTNVATMITATTSKITELRNRESDLSRQIKVLNETGITVDGDRIVPQYPFLYDHDPLSRRAANNLLEENVVVLGNTVTLEISFDANARNMRSGAPVTIIDPVSNQPLAEQGKIVGTKPGAQTVDLTHYTVDITLSRTLARHLYFPNAPLTTMSWVEVLYNNTKPAAVSTPAPSSAFPQKLNLIQRLSRFLKGLSFKRASPPRSLPAAPKQSSFQWFGLLWLVDWIRRRSQSSNGAPADIGGPDYHRGPPSEFLSGRPLDAVADQISIDHETPAQKVERSAQTSYLPTDFETFLSQIPGSVLKAERYWTAGDPMTFLPYVSAWVPIPWDRIRAKLGWVKEIKYKDHLVLFKEYCRRGANRLVCYLLDMKHRVDVSAHHASLRHTHLRWIIIFASGLYVSFYHLDPQFRQGVIDAFNTLSSAAPVLRSLGNRGFYIATTIDLMAILSMIVILGQYVPAIPALTLEVMAWLIRTILFLKPEAQFQSKTGVDGDKELAENRTKTILMPNAEDKAHEKFLLTLLETADIVAGELPYKFAQERRDTLSPLAKHITACVYFSAAQSRGSRNPIYGGVSPALPTIDDLLEQIRLQGIDLPKDPIERYRLLQWYQFLAVLDFAGKDSVRTYMGMLGSGSIDRLVDPTRINKLGPLTKINQALVRRLKTLETDIDDDARAQDRFMDIFDLNFYVYEGLRIKEVRKNQYFWIEVMKKFLAPAVRDYERDDWDPIYEDPEKAINSNPNGVRHMIEDLVLRQMKERPDEARNILNNLRYLVKKALLPSQGPLPLHPGLDVPVLLNSDGRSTTALALDTLYLQELGLLTDISKQDLEPPILETKNIYILFSDILNFKQLLIELQIYLKQTQGHIYLVDMKSDYPRFKRFLKNEIDARLSLSESARIHLKSLREIGDTMAKDENAVILSSRERLEWQLIQKFAGIRVGIENGFLNPAAMIQVIMTVGKDRLLNHLTERQKRLEAEYDALRKQDTDIDNFLVPARPELGEVELQHMESFSSGSSSHRDWPAFKKRQKKSAALSDKKTLIEEKRRRNYQALSDVYDLQHNLSMAKLRLQDNGIDTQITYDETAPINEELPSSTLDIRIRGSAPSNPIAEDTILLPTRDPDVQKAKLSTLHSTQDIAPDLVHYFENDVTWGTSELLYRIKNYGESLQLLPDPFFLVRESAGKIVGALTASKKQVLIEGKPIDVAYFSPSSRYHGYRMGRQLFQDLKDVLAKESDVALSFVYLEPNDLLFHKLARSFGYTDIGRFHTNVINRFYPKPSADVSLLRPDEREGMANALSNLYEGYALQDFPTSLLADRYYVLRDAQGEITAGLQVRQEHWKFFKMPGTNGWISMNIFPNIIPFTDWGRRRIFNPDESRYANIGNLYAQPGKERDLFRLIEHVLFLRKEPWAMAYIDERGPFYERLAKAGRFGLLNMDKQGVPVMAKAHGDPEKIKELNLIEKLKRSFLSISPLDISVFLLTVGLGLMQRFFGFSAGNAVSSAGLFFLPPMSSRVFQKRPDTRGLERAA